jgi:hypothetical protein
MLGGRKVFEICENLRRRQCFRTSSAARTGSGARPVDFAIERRSSPPLDGLFVAFGGRRGSQLRAGTAGIDAGPGHRRRAGVAVRFLVAATNGRVVGGADVRPQLALRFGIRGAAVFARLVSAIFVRGAGIAGAGAASLETVDGRALPLAGGVAGALIAILRLYLAGGALHRGRARLLGARPRPVGANAGIAAVRGGSAGVHLRTFASGRDRHRRPWLRRSAASERRQSGERRRRTGPSELAGHRHTDISQHVACRSSFAPKSAFSTRRHMFSATPKLERRQRWHSRWLNGSRRSVGAYPAVGHPPLLFAGMIAGVFRWSARCPVKG